MAFLGETFSTDDLPQSERSYDLLPDGWYNVTITKAELGTTKAGNGQKIDLRYDITGPTNQGRVIFGALNIRNPSQKAEEIGRQQLGEIMRAVGLVKVQDTDELIGKSLAVKVKTRPAENGYEARNEVAGFRAIAGGMAPAVTPVPATPSAAASPPWAKR